MRETEYDPIFTALIDIVVTEYIFDKFPKATSGQLSWIRSRAVCSPSLARIAIKELRLQNYLLHNNPLLGIAISKYIHHQLVKNDDSTHGYEEVVCNGWKHDPPKVLSDLTESVLGAMWVDSGYDYPRARAIVLKVMHPLLERLRPDLPKDPCSELMIWVGRKGCSKTKFKFCYLSFIRRRREY